MISHHCMAHREAAPSKRERTVVGGRTRPRRQRNFRNETEFVHWLQAELPDHARGLRLGIGDDAAVVRPSPKHDLILKSDMSIEDIHFRLNLHPPRSVAHRALARSLSDIAAMGGTPKYVLVSLALSGRIESSWIKDFYRELSAMARRFGIILVGGDTARNSDRVYIDIIAVGEVTRGRAIPRSGARPGDQIYVSGTLGLAALGLNLVTSNRAAPGLDRARTRSAAIPQRQGQGTNEQLRIAAQAVERHLYPEPRCALGRFLAGYHLASAMIDLSDGLSTDLGHLCASSSTGARIWANLIPQPETRIGIGPAQLSPQANQGGTNPSPPVPADQGLFLALHGGEDYELLFTVPKQKVGRIPAIFQGVPLYRIGEVRRSKDVWLVRADGRQTILRPTGYDHFKNTEGRNKHAKGRTKRTTNVQNH
jgi:thiamine-monophosphate kinase